MVDREKVTSGLHCCANIDGANCESCPYYISDSDCSAQMSMDALELLKEQGENPLRCDKCSYHREDGWCGMHGRWVKETDYCSWGEWNGGEVG